MQLHALYLSEININHLKIMLCDTHFEKTHNSDKEFQLQ